MFSRTGTSSSTAGSGAGPSRRPIPASSLRPRPERDLWGLGLSSDLPPDPPRDRPRVAPPRPAQDVSHHPLYRTESINEDSHVEVLSDVSRPRLTRLTSDLQRRAGSSRSVSRRGSMEKVQSGAAEIEVLIHQVCLDLTPADPIGPTERVTGRNSSLVRDRRESLQDVAHQLAILRKANKLWPSDPVHLRKHLYVPLEACRWHKASETLIRGEDGRVSLTPKRLDKGKGRATVPDLIDLEDPEELGAGSPAPSSPGLSRTVDVVRIPSSQLQFFPKQKKPPDSSRSSLDSTGSRNAMSEPPQSPSSRLAAALPSGATVRLRPPSSALSTGTGLADKFSNLFFIPPPPPGGLSIPPHRTRPRVSVESARSSQRGSTGSSVIPPEELEMFARARRGSDQTVKINGIAKVKKMD